MHMNLFRGITAAFVIAAAMAAPAIAQTESAQSTPRARRAFGYYDTQLRRVVIIGGPSQLRPGARDSVFSWSGLDWELVTANGPEARGNPGVGHDPGRRITVFTGGVRRMANDSAHEINRAAWVHRNGQWSIDTTANTDARDHHVITYDEERRALIMYGGIPGDRSAHWPTNTWQLEANGWQQIANDGPPGRGRTAMVYDSKRKQLVVFGGAGEAPARGEPQPFFGDTWVFDRNGWRKVSDSGPRGRYAHGMVFDEKAGVVLLYSGAAAHRDAPLSDMWQWNGERWTEIKLTGPTPGFRYSPVMVYDRARKRTVLYGGSGAPGDTWEWNGRSWKRIR
jgi:hypothetical protein